MTNSPVYARITQIDAAEDTLQSVMDLRVVGGGSGSDTVAWDDVTGKPATFPPTVGTTADTAKAGNYVPAYSEVTGKPTTFTPITGTTAGTAAAGNDSRLTAQAAGTASVRALAGGTATTASASDHAHTATQVTATAISPGTATNTQGILAELAARLAAAELAITALQTA